MRLKSIKKIENASKRYDIQTSSKNFYANNILVHNSLLIVSRYKGEWILRTRGTVDARQLPNGHEIDLLMEKYKLFFNEETPQILAEYFGRVSFLFEWTTPTNIIVLRESEEPKLILLGWIYNETAELGRQHTIDRFNEDCLGGLFDRPQKYEYNSIEECILDVKAWEGKEGVVIYSPDYQTMKKIKADLYCELHKLATGMNSVKDVLNVFMESPMFTKYSEFYEYIETTLDYEIAEKVKEEIRDICVAYSKVVDKLNNVTQVVNNVRTGFSRKEQALEFQNHWSDWRVPAAFQLLDNNEVNEKTLRKGIEHELGI